MYTVMNALTDGVFTMSVVFAVLILLWAAVRLFSFVMGIFEGKKER